MRERDEVQKPKPQRSIGVVGYGNIGRAFALNACDAGIHILVSGRGPETAAARLAREDGFEWAQLSSLASTTSTVFLALPDEVLEKEWDQVRAAFPVESLLLFATGWVPWKKNLREAVGCYGLLAPKGAGSKWRERYLDGSGLTLVVDSFGHLPKEKLDAILADLTDLARRVSGGPQEVICARAEDECLADLMSEQVILCGGLPALMALAYQWMRQQDIPEKLAWVECVHEARLIAEMIERDGLSGMYEKISPMARKGGLFRAEQMMKLLEPYVQSVGEEIKTGTAVPRESPAVAQIFKTQELLKFDA